jgi:heme exporter protein B
MSASLDVQRALTIAGKDLAIERRAKANFNAVVFLAATMLLLFGFALGPDAEALRGAAAGVLWLTVLFSGSLAFNRSYQVELDDGALETLLLYPGSRKSIFVGKLLANLVFILLVEALLVPMAAVLYGLSFADGLAGIALAIALGTIGFVTMGTFYAAMSSRLRAREVLLPLLLFPMLVPLLVGAVEVTGAFMGQDPFAPTGRWLVLMAVYDVVFLLATIGGYDFVIDD